MSFGATRVHPKDGACGEPDEIGFCCLGPHVLGFPVAVSFVHCKKKKRRRALCAGEPTCAAFAAKWSPNNQDNSHCYLYGPDIATGFGGKAPGPAVRVAYLTTRAWRFVGAAATTPKPAGPPTNGVGPTSYQCYVRASATTTTPAVTTTAPKQMWLVVLGPGACQTEDGGTQPQFYKSRVSREDCQNKCIRAPFCEGIFWFAKDNAGRQLDQCQAYGHRINTPGINKNVFTGFAYLDANGIGPLTKTSPRSSQTNGGQCEVKTDLTTTQTTTTVSSCTLSNAACVAYGVAGVNACPAGMKRISSNDECTTAAAAIANGNAGKQSPQAVNLWPAGCFVDQKTGRLFFNTPTYGSGRGAYKQR